MKDFMEPYANWLIVGEGGVLFLFEKNTATDLDSFIVIRYLLYQ